jgi:dihydropteroate synthase
LELSARPLVMGILNITPDSFSDGGRFFSAAAAIEQGRRLAEAGADLLDMGGESSRPYATPVALDEELRRVLPVVQALRQAVTIPLSIDTTKPAIARAAIEAGAEIINDISGFSAPEMLALAAQSRAGVCAMHMQGTPATMQDAPVYADVVAEVGAFLRERREALLAAGVTRERICLDPGIGFGKTHAHNIALMAHCWRLHSLGCPLLVGHSRKGFIGKLSGNSTPEQTAGTLAASLALAAQGVQILRVHDVAATREALSVFAACCPPLEPPAPGEKRS